MTRMPTSSWSFSPLPSDHVPAGRPALLRGPLPVRRLFHAQQLHRTFISWQSKRFRLFWRNKCQSGRPRIPLDLQRLIRTMARENPSWGQERVANELLVKLGLRVSPRTIRKYLPESAGAPGGNRRRDQRWSTFLKNHAAAIIACDFFVVVNASFRIFYVLVVMDMLHAELF